ncbi:hypothetical protein ACHAW5_010986 [Stephanodiscus triporus]|uniref:Glycosyltransferase n=1 Tax=Stephanodiscus triporus TaxID=2934178 RepID=A0ABD3NP82_9STRA
MISRRAPNAARGRRYIMPGRGTRSRAAAVSLRSMTSSDGDSNDDDDDDDDEKERRRGGGRGSLLFLSPSNWPEPDASAAGTRTMALLRHFSSHCPPLFDSVHFGCGAGGGMPSSSSSSSSSIFWHRIRPNRADEMHELLNRINDDHGPIRAVVFDRFHAEEAYSFRVRDTCPNALLVLDMQDVHSLRLGRQQVVEEMDDDPTSVAMMTDRLASAVAEFDPSSPNRDARDAFLRELASVHRSDLVLVCSAPEMGMLVSWGVPAWKLVLAPFFCSDVDVDVDRTGTTMSLPPFGGRRDFAFVGGFRHPPNVDSVRVLRREVWPLIRSRMPRARVRVFGAYPTPDILSLHDEDVGFLVRGRVDDLDDALRRSRVLLAPLRFGAGIKGKIVDAWRCDCPVVTTRVGAEGTTTTTTTTTKTAIDDDGGDDLGARTTIADNCRWGGIIADDAVDFAKAAVELHEREDLWNRCRDNGTGSLRRIFNGRVNLPVVERGIRDGIADLAKQRTMDIFGSILWRDARRSTEYFSRWIELKETLNGAKDK